jgi:hypothetical protein
MNFNKNVTLQYEFQATVITVQTEHGAAKGKGKVVPELN